MSRESKIPGEGKDHPHRRRQYFRSLVHDAFGPTPTEIFHKVVDEEPLPTPAAVFEAASKKATKLFSVLRRSTAAVHIDAKTMNNLGEIAIMREDRHAIRRWGDLCEKMNSWGRLDQPLARFYFTAAQLGDIESSENLHAQLQKEKNQAIAAGSLTGTYDSFSLLQSVVDQSAEKGILADEWITSYALDANHVTNLKLRYYEKTKNYSDEAKAIGERYRDEITDQFLQGEGYTNPFAWIYEGELYKAQTDPTKKKAILAQLQTRDTEIPLVKTAWYKFFAFAKHVLTDKHTIASSDAYWLEEVAERITIDNLEHGTIEAIDAQREVNRFQVAVARYKKATPQQLLQLIDAQSRALLNRQPPIADEETIFHIRDATLARLSDDYSRSGDFADALMFSSAITDEVVNDSARDKQLKQVVTQADLEMITPDEMAFEFDSGLKRSKNLFTAKKALLGKDPQELVAAARLLADATTNNPSLQRIFLPECIETIYEKDPKRGEALSTEIISQLKQQSSKSEMIITLASLQIEHGNNNGWTHLLEQEIQTTDPIEQLKRYAALSVQAARMMDEEDLFYDDY